MPRSSGANKVCAAGFLPKGAVNSEQGALGYQELDLA
jgi:hypothetical protein